MTELKFITLGWPVYNNPVYNANFFDRKDLTANMAVNEMRTRPEFGHAYRIFNTTLSAKWPLNDNSKEEAYWLVFRKLLPAQAKLILWGEGWLQFKGGNKIMGRRYSNKRICIQTSKFKVCKLNFT